MGVAMNLVCASLLLALLTGCQASEDISKQELERLQSQSALGRTEGWRIRDVRWRGSLQDMRDAAYRFCLNRHGGASTCFDQQDVSLQYSALSDDYVADVRAGRKQGTTPLREAILKQSPGQYRKAREYCFSVYRDSGSGDARSLGPCITNAVGEDYFSMEIAPYAPVM